MRNLVGLTRGLIFVLISSQAFAGTEGRGGQFQFASDPSVVEKILQGREAVLDKMNSLSQDEINKIFDYQNVDKARFINALSGSNLKLNLACIRIRRTDDGNLENQLLDFGPREAPQFEQFCETYSDNEDKEDRVEVLERFATFVQLGKYNDQDIQRHLVHENLHRFGYSQKKADEYSRRFVAYNKPLLNVSGVPLWPDFMQEEMIRRIGFVVDDMKIRNSPRTFRNACGHTVQASYNPNVGRGGLIEIRDTFYDSANSWYVVSVNGPGKKGVEWNGIKLVEKEAIDSFMTANTNNLQLKDVYSLMWGSGIDGSTPLKFYASSFDFWILSEAMPRFNLGLINGVAVKTTVEEYKRVLQTTPVRCNEFR